jgi:hypothetical protein
MKILTLLPFLLLTNISNAQIKYLVPYRDGALWGYSDTNMNMVVPPLYDHTDIHFLGFGVLTKNSLMGLVNQEGDVILQPEYQELNNCCYDSVLVVKKQDRYGIISLPGSNIILPFMYDNIQKLKENTYLIKDEKTRLGIFNIATKKWLLPLLYDTIENVGDHYSAKKGSTKIYFRIFKNGTLSAFVPQKERPEKLTQNKKSARLPPAAESLYGWDNPDGMPEGGSLMTTFQEEEKTGLYYITKRNGLLTSDTIPAMYDSMKYVNGHYDIYIVSLNGKQGIVTVNNTIILPLEYDEIWSVKNEGLQHLLTTRKGNKTGIINIDRKEIVPCIYDEIRITDSTVSSGIFIVKSGGLYGLVKGIETILPTEYDNIEFYPSSVDGYYLYKNGKQGLIMYSGSNPVVNAFIPPNYDVIMGVNKLAAYNFGMDYLKSEKDQATFIIADVFKNGKRGFVDYKGREYFKN